MLLDAPMTTKECTATCNGDAHNLNTRQMTQAHHKWPPYSMVQKTHEQMVSSKASLNVNENTVAAASGQHSPGLSASRCMAVSRIIDPQHDTDDEDQAAVVPTAQQSPKIKGKHTAHGLQRACATRCI